INYFDRFGFWPLMHVVVAANDVVEKYPWAMRTVYDAFNQAMKICYSQYDIDPNFSSLAWGRHIYEKQRECFPNDPWTNGIGANSANLEQFISYAVEQGVLPEPLAIKDLFYNGLLDT